MMVTKLRPIGNIQAFFALLFTAIFTFCSFTNAHARDDFLDIFSKDRVDCYKRDYDKTHLAKHPHQKVTSIFVGFSPFAKHAIQPNIKNWLVKVYVTLRGSEETYKGIGFCAPGKGAEKGHVRCGFEDDGGAFLLKPHKKHSILLINKSGFYLDRNNGARIYEDPLKNLIKISSGRDDKVFRLNAMRTTSLCLEEIGSNILE